MNQEPKPMDLIKQGLSMLQADWEVRCRLVDAVRLVDGDLNELAGRREMDEKAKCATPSQPSAS